MIGRYAVDRADAVRSETHRSRVGRCHQTLQIGSRSGKTSWLYLALTAVERSQNLERFEISCSSVGVSPLSCGGWCGETCPGGAGTEGILGSSAREAEMAPEPGVGYSDHLSC